MIVTLSGDRSELAQLFDSFIGSLSNGSMSATAGLTGGLLTMRVREQDSDLAAGTLSVSGFPASGRELFVLWRRTRSGASMGSVKWENLTRGQQASWNELAAGIIRTIL